MPDSDEPIITEANSLLNVTRLRLLREDFDEFLRLTTFSMMDPVVALDHMFMLRLNKKNPVHDFSGPHDPRLWE